MRHISMFNLPRDQAQNACDGGLHVKCDTTSRNFHSVPLARVITK